MITYFALTIGPLINTISTARTTREMWASSYLFSYIIREITKAFNDNNFNNKVEILLPSPRGIAQKNYIGAGLYPDRIVLKLADDKLSKDDFQNIINAVIDDFANNITNQLKARKDVIEIFFKKEDVAIYLHSYFSIYYLKKQLQDSDNIINTLYPLLDTFETQPVVPVQEKELPLTIFKKLLAAKPSKAQQKVSPLRLFTDLVNDSFLFHDGFGNNSERKLENLKSKKRFSSVIEIASIELKRKDEEKYKKLEDFIQAELSEFYQLDIENQKQDKTTYEALEDESVTILKKNFGEEFKTYHQYIAIVHADGDRVGKMIANLQKVTRTDDNITLSQTEALKVFSQLLVTYAREVANIIDDYGGTPVYVGGDEMFFFAPVSSITNLTKESQTIFDLVHVLDEKFNELIRDQKAYNFNLDPGLQPSLSYGICISYFKFPLFEARKKSYDDLLIKIAKAHHNAIAVSLLKHSGHDISFTILKNKPFLFKDFRELVSAHVTNKENFINSITYKLEAHKEILKQIAANSSRINHFFKNNFNENYEANKTFYESLEKYITALAISNGSSKDEQVLTDDDYNLLYATLRFIHFLKSSDK